MKEGRKEGNILFNDAHNTFYLRLYGVRLMVKNHSNNERESPLPPHGLLPISSKGSFITHTTTFVQPVVDHWLERERITMNAVKRLIQSIFGLNSYFSHHGELEYLKYYCIQAC